MVYDQQGFHPGNTLFSGISDITGMSLDQINFIVSQVVLLLFASILRTHFHPTKSKASTRHWFELVLGVLAGLFCFGRHALHLITMPGICYVIMAKMNPNIMQRVVLAISLTYLSVLHLYRQIYDYGSSNIDVTGPIMVMTQKVTSLAFSLHDGRTKAEDQMNKTQKLEAIRETPSLLTYFSYCLTFQTLMAGPSVSFKVYLDFIEGKNDQEAIGNAKKTDSESMQEPSPFYPVLYKLLTATACGVIFIILGRYFPLSGLKESKFLDESSIPYKFWYMYLCLLVCRLKYYFAWMFADAICNSSGLGFNGYTEDGKELWNGVSNVDIFKFEVMSWWFSSTMGCYVMKAHCAFEEYLKTNTNKVLYIISRNLGQQKDCIQTSKNPHYHGKVRS